MIWLGIFMLAIGLLTSCISINTHERCIVDVQEKDFQEMDKWLKEFQKGELSMADLTMLMRGRWEVIQMRRMRIEADRKRN